MSVLAGVIVGAVVALLGYVVGHYADRRMSKWEDR